MRDSLRKICCLAPLLAAVVLVVVLYFLRYDTVGTEDALVQAASEYTGKELEAIILKEIPGADGTCDGKGDLVLLCRSTGAEESSSPENSSDKKTAATNHGTASSCSSGASTADMCRWKAPCTIIPCRFLMSA